MNKFLIFVIMFTTGVKVNVNPHIAVKFAGEEWSFPLTVGEAVKKYKLSYKPPGYYYSVSDHVIVSLKYDYETDDFVNEHQPQELLYARNVNTYVFTYKWQDGKMDSLQNAIQSQFSKQIEIAKDESYFTLKENRLNSAKLSSIVKPVSYGLMQIDSSLILGLREKPSLSRKAPRLIEVLLMHDLSSSEIRKRMISF